MEVTPQAVAEAGGLEQAALPTHAEVRAAAQPGETAAQTAARLYKVKVDGEEMEVDEAELLRGYAHQKAASKRMADAAAERALAEEVMGIFKSNPKQAFEKLGLNAKQFAEQLLMEEMEESVLTDEQKEVRELKRFKESIEQREKAAREKESADAEEAFRTQVAQELQTNIVTALDSAELPKNEFTVSRMAFYLESCLKAGYNATPQDVVSHVKAEYEKELKGLIGGFKDDQLMSFLGDDVVKKVVKGHIAKTGVKKPAVVKPSTTTTAKPDQKKGRLSDFFRPTA